MIDPVRAGELLATVSAIPVTPFTPDGSIDADGLRNIVGRIVDGGVSLVVPGGNTSEIASLTAEEASLTTAIVIEETLARGGDVLVGVGGDPPTAARTARDACELGALGVMVHQPSFPYQSEDGLVAYYAGIAEATSGVVVPYIRGSGLPERVLAAVIDLPNVVAVKYALPDVVRFAQFVRGYSERVVPICGLAEGWAPFYWLAGARGFTSGLVNVDAALPLALLTALRAGDWSEAMRVWSLCRPFEELRARPGNANNVPVVKAALAMLGVVGAVVRPPLTTLTPEDEQELARIVPTLAPA
jgi:4-hydroxy-tetrahydrodipicolinate synthase